MTKYNPYVMVAASPVTYAQDDTAMAISYAGTVVATLDIKSYKLQRHHVNYQTRCNLHPHCARPAKINHEVLASDATYKVCHIAWQIFQQERDFYFARKQAQLTMQLERSGLTVPQMLEVLHSFNQFCQPAPRDFTSGCTRQLTRILQTRMPEGTEKEAAELIRICKDNEVNVATCIRYVVLNARKI